MHGVGAAPWLLRPVGRCHAAQLHHQSSPGPLPNCSPSHPLTYATQGFLTSDFSKRDEFSNVTRTEQWREQLDVSSV